MVLPLLVAVTIAHGFTVLTLRRSILTEKIARAGMIVYRMAETGLTRFPVVDRTHRRLIGMIALTDLLKARALNLDAEQRRERVLGAHIQLPFGEKLRKGSLHP